MFINKILSKQIFFFLLFQFVFVFISYAQDETPIEELERYQALVEDEEFIENLGLEEALQLRSRVDNLVERVRKREKLEEKLRRSPHLQRSIDEEYIELLYYKLIEHIDNRAISCMSEDIDNCVPCQPKPRPNPNPQPIPTPKVPYKTRKKPEEKKPEPPKEEAAKPAKPKGCTIYGQHVFESGKLDVFQVAQNVTPPDSYILGPGDEVVISVFGTSQGEFKFLIEEDGFIKPTEIPKIYLKGITFAKARDLLFQRFSANYRVVKEQFAVTIGKSREINVSIFGEIRRHGSFNIPAHNTAFNAIVAAGGPTSIGSIRQIKLVRDGQSQLLDVYEFMMSSQKQFDFQLYENDVIHIPVVEKVVEISGAVKRPMCYELLDCEDLIALLGFSGGIKDKAFKKAIQVKRYFGNEYKLLDVDLDDILSNEKDFRLYDGDEIIVKNIKKEVKDYVTISGAIDYPGTYELEYGMRIVDLLGKGVMNKYTKQDLAFVMRLKADKTYTLIKVDLAKALAGDLQHNVLLRPEDKLVLYEQSQYTQKSVIHVVGAVRKPIKKFPYDTDKGVSLEDAILLAGGLKPNAANIAYILRSDLENIDRKEYIEVNVWNAINDPSSAANIKLLPNDKLIVYGNERYTDALKVKVSGAVREPGEFDYAESMTFRDLLVLAGGMKLQAARNRIDLFRIEIKENQPTETLVMTLEINDEYDIIKGANAEFELQPFDHLVVREAPEFELQKTITLNGEVKYPGVYALLHDNEPITSVIQRAGGFTLEADIGSTTLERSYKKLGFVVFDLEVAIEDSLSTDNVILMDGDIVIIPKTQNLVSIEILGTRAEMVYSDKMIDNGLINVSHQKNKKAKWYIKNYAAGFAKDADKRFISVEQPGGKISVTKNYWLFKVSPKVKSGSKIKVGLKPRKIKKRKVRREKGERVDWDKKLSTLLTTVTSVAALILILTQIKNLNG